MPLSLIRLGGWRRVRPGAGPTPAERALRWIQRCSDERGVWASGRTRVPYPEVTGYTIPTLLALGEPRLARQWARALVAAQQPDGAILGTDGRPYFFDTAQVMRGWLALVDGEPGLSEPIERAGRWLAAQVGPDGRLPGSYNATIPEAVHLYALPPLRDAGRRLRLPALEEGAARALTAFLQDGHLTEFTTLTHFLGYILDGLLELGETQRARAGAAALLAHQRGDGEVPGRPGVAWTCTVGLAQLAVVWYRLEMDGPADRAMAALAQRQRASGGFRGSHGRGAAYFRGEEISWAAKFFLDATCLQSARFFARNSTRFPREIVPGDGRLVTLLDALKPAAHGRILEVGCGRGRFARAVKATFPQAQVTAADFSPALLGDLPAEIAAVEAGMLALPFPDDSFDAAYLVEALEHALVPATAIREACRVVRPGGRVAIIDKDRRSLGRLTIAPWERWFDGKEVSAWLREACDEVVARPVPCGGEIRSEAHFLAWTGRRSGRLDAQAWSRAILPSELPGDVARRALRGPASHWVRPILDVTHPGDLLLELGSGTGAMSSILAQAGRHVLLLDRSRDCLTFSNQVVTALGGHAMCLQADVLHGLPLSDASVDCVWSSGLLEHFTQDELVSVLRESARVSRRAVVSLVPNAASLPYRVGKWHQERSGAWQWGHEAPRFSLRKEFEAVGLRGVHEESVDAAHALGFLTMPEAAAFRELLRAWLETVRSDEQRSLNQGYLLATLGFKA